MVEVQMRDISVENNERSMARYVEPSEEIGNLEEELNNVQRNSYRCRMI